MLFYLFICMNIICFEAILVKGMMFAKLFRLGINIMYMGGSELL